MSSASRERFLFVVTVNKDVFTDTERLTAFKAKIDGQRSARSNAFIAEVHARFSMVGEDTGLAQAQPELLAIDWYIDLFVGVVELNGLAVTVQDSSADLEWTIPGQTVQQLVRAIFQPLNDDNNTNFSYLIWAMTRLQAVCAGTVDTFSLLGMKGIGSEV